MQQKKVVLIASARDAHSLLNALRGRGHNARLVPPGIDDDAASGLILDSEIAISIGPAMMALGAKTFNALIALRSAGRHSVFCPEPPNDASILRIIERLNL